MIDQISCLHNMTLNDIAVEIWNNAPRMIQSLPVLSEEEMHSLQTHLDAPSALPAWVPVLSFRRFSSQPYRKVLATFRSSSIL